jgi:small subunit ribosomal protein S11
MAKAGGKKKVFRKKEKKNVPNGIVHIAASFNNTMISITDLEGNLIRAIVRGRAWFSWFAQGHSLRRAASCIRSSQEGARGGHAPM